MRLGLKASNITQMGLKSLHNTAKFGGKASDIISKYVAPAVGVALGPEAGLGVNAIGSISKIGFKGLQKITGPK
tara:strand:+ start:2204 stop:2425 length:222 start_codon:yes stop_codon:yes gene_type:complete